MKDIMKANNPMASVNAKANIDKPNNEFCILGFLAVPLINALKTNPAPMAAPPNAMVDIPAPINLAPSNIYCYNYISCLYYLNNDLYWLSHKGIAILCKRIGLDACNGSIPFNHIKII